MGFRKKILSILSKSPFEPLQKCSLKFLTWKTVFITAISTFGRCSDIQALRTDAGYMNILSEGVIFVREGLSKQDRPSHNSKRIFVLCFKKNNSLDPKRAVEIYLKRTAELRSSSVNQEVKHLFLSVNKPHKAVSKQTIASWIINVIKLAYDESEVTIRAHSIRAIVHLGLYSKELPLLQFLKQLTGVQILLLRSTTTEKCTLKVGSFKVCVQSFYIQRVPEDRIDIFSIFHDIICHYEGK